MSDSVRVAGLWSSRYGVLGPHEISFAEGKILGVHPLSVKAAPHARGFAIPGIIDTHVHLCFDPSVRDVTHFVREAKSGLRHHIVTSCKQAAAAGVTTVADMGDQMGIVRHTLDRSAQEVTGLPTVVSVGAPLTISPGHCDFLGGAIDPRMSSPHEAVLANQSSGRLKIMLSGGILTPGSDAGDLQFSPHYFRGLVESAKQLGLLVHVHAHSPDAIELAATVGVQSIEHCTFQGRGPTYGFTEGALAALERSRQTTSVCPTLVDRPGLTQQPDRLAWRRLVVAELVKRNVPLTLGTDAGVLQGLGFDSAPFMILTLLRCGLSPEDALTVATRNSADVLGLGETKGHLEPGYDADIVVLDGSPILEPAVIAAPLLVILRGLSTP